MRDGLWMMDPVSHENEVERAAVRAIVNFPIDKCVPCHRANDCHEQQAHKKDTSAPECSSKKAPHTPNDLFRRKEFGLCAYWPTNAELAAAALNLPPGDWTTRWDIETRSTGTRALSWG
jgi:hypothetical protein